MFSAGIGHMIDYKRTNVAIEAFYILIPLFVSLIVMILMACHYGIGAQFMPSGFVATAVRFQMKFVLHAHTCYTVFQSMFTGAITWTKHLRLC